MKATARPATAGATRACPHCKATILESAVVCPACRGHLRYDSAAQAASVPASAPESTSAVAIAVRRLSRKVGLPLIGR